MRRWKPKWSLKHALLFWLGLSVLLAWQRENVATSYYRMMGVPAFRLVENRVQFKKVLKQERAVLFVGPDWSASSQFMQAKFTEFAERTRARWPGVKFFKIDSTAGVPPDLGFVAWVWEQEPKTQRWRHGYGTTFLMSRGELIETIEELEVTKFDPSRLIRKFKQGSRARTKKPH